MKSITPSPYAISFLTLRKAIGILGMLLPAMLLLGTFTIGKCTHVQDSISHYYYTVMGDVFVGTLCAVALFLIFYKGYDRYDNIATNIAGAFALGAAFFATTNNPDAGCTIRTLPDLPWRTTVHYASAALFFTTLAFISFFLFTKSKGIITRRKKTRNTIYRTCGIVMMVALALIVAFKFSPWMQQLFMGWHLVFWLEWLALIAFGTSWLVKGGAIYPDKIVH